jgi:phospholipid/cholesterol/gamma-HCH transport system substrate-binding protein
MNVSRYVKVALFFIVLGSAGGGYIILSSDGFNQFNTSLYEVTLPDATGLSTRSKIYLAGVAVGKIQAIALDGNEARLQVAFLKDLDIRGDARITRKSSSILGTAMLALEPGTELTPLVAPGGHIGADKTTGDMNAVLDMARGLGGQLTGLLEEFRTTQMALLTTSLETFNSIAQKIDRQSEEELERVSRILTAAALITERTERLLASREEDIAGSVTEMRGALENLRAVTGEIRHGQGNIGQAIYDDRLYRSLLSTVEKTEAAAGELQRAIQSVTELAGNVNGVVSSAGEIVDRANGLGIQVDTQARYGMLSGRVNAGASLRLNPRSNDRWYRIGVATAPDGLARRTIRETYDAGGERSDYEDTTERTFTVSIDAELARRFGPVTLRGGLLESTAGFGIDIQPVRWVSLSGELYNFRTGASPALRGTLTVYPFFDPDGDKPWNWLYLRGGVSDALNGSRDFFLGGGIRFADREVKGLVGLLPVFAGN